MQLSELLTELAGLDAAQLLKVRKTVDMLLGGVDDVPDTWDAQVWDAVSKSLKTRGLRMPAFTAVQSNPDRKRRLADGADAIRQFLQVATRETDDHKLRPSLAFVAETCVRRMEKGKAPMSAGVVLNRLTDFPAYMVHAFPGCNASPNQFSMIRTLFHKKPTVS